MKKHMRQVKLADITITDELFKSYVDKVADKIIPHQWKILNDQLEDAEPTYCIENFKVCAGEKKGTRRGVVFQDTDIYKWLEAVAFCLESGHGRQYESLADEVIELIGRAQEPDGYLNTYFSVNAPDKKWTNLIEGHELYTSGHMIEAAVAYYQATGKKQILTIAQKNADLICEIFGRGDGQIAGYPGHQEIELALIKLYRVTGEKQYLRQADYFIRERGREPNYFVEEIRRHGAYEFFPEFKDYDLKYSQAHEEPIRQTQAEGHAVRAMYMSAAMADLAQEENDPEMLAACKRIWDSAVNRRMYITGGIGSSGFCERFTTDYDLPNSTNYSETCASIGLMMFGKRMTEATGDARYYGVVERALYNTVLAGMNLEGDRYFYVNPLEVVPEFCTEHTYMNHVKPIRQKWFSVACCPPNVARTLASLGQYIYAQDDENIYIHQYISSNMRAELASGEVELEMKSDINQTGKVAIHIQSEGAGTVKVRIPDYSDGYQVTVDGRDVEPIAQSGYSVIEFGSGSTVIELTFAIIPHWLGTDQRVRADIGKAALQRGPFVYCLEQIDNGDLLAQIYIDKQAQVNVAEPETRFVGNIPTLEYQGVRLNTQVMKQDSLYGDVCMEKTPVQLRAVPYCFWNNRGEGEMLVWHKLLI